jgi:uncharacterized protein with HEPN domain
MPSKSPDTALRDILYHIDLAAHFAAALDYERFQQDMRTVYAVTRCLEIISEASRRLLEAMKSRHPSIAWRDMAGAGNVYRHDYDDVAARHVWHTLTRDLQPLRLVVLEELRNLGDSP